MLDKLSEFEIKLNDLMKNGATAKNMATLNTKVDEIRSLYLFFQKFIDEQGNDMVRVNRGHSFSLIQKLNAMEWTARYIEFLSIENIKDIISAFNEYMRTDDKFNPFQHSSEVISTIIQKIKQKDD